MRQEIPQSSATTVLLTGRPGSGKSTLARRLGDAMVCPVVSRDEIAHGIACGLANSEKELVNRLAFDAFFCVLEAYASRRVTVLADAAFQHSRWSAGLGPILPLVQVKVIHCTVDAAIAQQRVAARKIVPSGAQPTNVPSPGVEPQVVGPPRSFDPPSLEVPALSVATADGYEPGLDVILAFVEPQTGTGS